MRAKAGVSTDVTQDAGQSQDTFDAKLELAIPGKMYPLAHTSLCARSYSAPNHAPLRLVDMTLCTYEFVCMYVSVCK